MRIPKRATAGASAAALTAALAVIAAPAPGAAAACRPDAGDLLLTYQPIDHTVADAQYVRARLTLANRDRRCGLGHDWALYFTSVRRPAAVLSGTVGEAARRRLADQGLTVARADKAQSGDFYVLEPTAAFRPVGPGQRRAVDIDMELWSVHKSDAPAGWAIAFGRGAPRWVPAKSLLDPNDPKQTKAFSGDNRPVQNAATRFAENSSIRPVRLTLRQRLVPQPLSATETGGTVRIGGASPIRYDGELRGEADYLRSALRDVARGRGAPITLRLDPRLDVDGNGRPDAEGYRLTATGGGVRIVGADRAGVLYGVQTLRQLVPASAYRAAAGGDRASTVAVPRAVIADAPLFGYRGLMIDVSRHFESKRTIMKFLDLMAFTKLNRLHLGLSNDEGWRLEIPGLPELTGFGARRAFDPAERRALHPAMGSVDDLGGGDGIGGKPRDEAAANLGPRPSYQGYEHALINFVGKGGGHYSVRDFQEILRYATERHIEVVPEFDMPAHARAAVLAMERRHERTGDATYRLVDPADTSRHVSVQGYTDNLVNPCVPGTYRFLDKVVTEVAKMYRAAGAPLNRINLGGDEPPGPPEGWWSGSPACQANPETAGKSGEELADLFFTKWNRIALKAARTTAGWEDATAPDRALRLKNFAPLAWQNVWGWGREDWAYRFANEGTPVILAHATNLYMDLAYNKDPDEVGYYWAAYVDEKSTFTYQPFDVYANATEDRWGNPLTPDPRWERLTEKGRANILGLEAQLWGENGKTPRIREYQAFPKMLGVAERAWNRRTPSPERMPEAWNVFSNTLGQVAFPLLSFYRPVGLPGETGVNYRVPLPGGRISGGTLTANVRNPGMTVEYSTDGIRWRTYTGPAAVGSYALTRTRAADGRTSRISPVDVPAWQSGAAYARGAVVTHQGELYRAARPSTGRAPDLSPDAWIPVR